MATMTAISTRDRELADGYLAALPQSAGALIVITDRTEVEARARDLQAKLASLGISDVTEEGALILGGAVELTPGLRKGIRTPTISTSTELDLDTLPEMFGYTRPVGLLSTILVDGGLTKARTSTRFQSASPGRTLAMTSSPGLLADEALIVADELQ